MNTVVMMVSNGMNSTDEFGEKLKSNAPVTSFLRKHGDNWRWAVLLRLLVLFNDLNIVEVGHDNLSFTVQKKKSDITRKDNELNFQERANLILKLCQVKIRVSVIDQKESLYLITIF